jgi:hypothetical protein
MLVPIEKPELPYLRMFWYPAHVAKPYPSALLPADHQHGEHAAPVVGERYEPRSVRPVVIIVNFLLQ